MNGKRKTRRCRALARLSLAGAVLGGAVLNPAPARAEEQMVIHFFGSRTCLECLEIKEELLLPLAEEYPSALDLRLHETEDPEGLRLMLELETRHNVSNPAPQELFLPRDCLIGTAEILEKAEALIRDRMKDPGGWKPLEPARAGESVDPLQARFREITFAGILFAGLIDGVNPCAIATIIFLVSFLALQKRSRTQVIAIGAAFTAAVYLTYLMLGAGAFRFITLLDSYRIVSQIVRWAAVALASLVGLLSFRDALAYRKSGDTGQILLQMPKAVKLRVHKLISGHLRGRHLLLGAAVTGFLVTLFEAVCTGQVYLPAIIVMSRTAGSRAAGWLYLILYNVLFVLPLLIIVVLAGFGLTWNKLAQATQRNLSRVKILMGIAMLLLAAFLALA